MSEPLEKPAKKKALVEFLRLVKFALFSISAGIVEILVFTLLNEFTGFSYWPCYLTALICSILWAFFWNRSVTFKSDAFIPRVLALSFAFYLVFTPVTTIGGNYLVETLGWNEYLVTVINMLLNFSLEFLYDRLFVYRNTIDSKVK